uniref:Uncharacterized protein n=1 Tax=Vitis vinifera TaxID=29760 RepID=A5BDF5_VITVI|nr:hypothetical protein VITISV_019257 [Vitis vinifera]
MTHLRSIITCPSNNDSYNKYQVSSNLGNSGVGFIVWCTVAEKCKGRLAPGPSDAWPFLGHLPLLRGQTPIFRTLGAMVDKQDPVFMIRLGVHRALVFQCRKAGYNYAGFGFTPYRALWREMRKLSMMEILSARRLDALTHVQISELDLFIKDLDSLGKGSDWVHPVKLQYSLKDDRRKEVFQYFWPWKRGSKAGHSNNLETPVSNGDICFVGGHSRCRMDGFTRVFGVDEAGGEGSGLSCGRLSGRT